MEKQITGAKSGSGSGSEPALESARSKRGNIHVMFQTDSGEDVIFVSEKCARKSREITVDQVLICNIRYPTLNQNTFLLTS